MTASLEGEELPEGIKLYTVARSGGSSKEAKIKHIRCDPNNRTLSVIFYEDYQQKERGIQGWVVISFDALLELFEFSLVSAANEADAQRLKANEHRRTAREASEQLWRIKMGLPEA